MPCSPRTSVARVYDRVVRPEIWIPVGVALAAGLAVLSWRTGAYFRQLALNVIALASIVVFGIILWNVAVTRTFSRLNPVMNGFLDTQAREIRTSLLVPDEALVVSLGVIAYVILLIRLAPEKSLRD